MMKHIAILIFICLGLAASARELSAAAAPDTDPSAPVRVVEEEIIVEEIPAQKPDTTAIAPKAAGKPGAIPARKFAWGVELASNIDMGCDDMSSIAFNAYLGFSAPVFPIIGVGAGVNVPVSNSCRSIPLFAVVRTNFTPRKSLMFLDLRGGMSVNYLENNKRQTGGYFSACVGVNLAGGASFQSYLMAGYSFYPRKNYFDADNVEVNLPSLHMAAIRFGISF